MLDHVHSVFALPGSPLGRRLILAYLATLADTEGHCRVLPTQVAHATSVPAPTPVPARRRRRRTRPTPYRRHTTRPLRDHTNPDPEPDQPDGPDNTTDTHAADGADGAAVGVTDQEQP